VPVALTSHDRDFEESQYGGVRLRVEEVTLGCDRGIPVPHDQLCLVPEWLEGEQVDSATLGPQECWRARV